MQDTKDTNCYIFYRSRFNKNNQARLLGFAEHNQTGYTKTWSCGETSFSTLGCYREILPGTAVESLHEYMFTGKID